MHQAGGVTARGLRLNGAFTSALPRLARAVAHRLSQEFTAQFASSALARAVLLKEIPHDLQNSVTFATAKRATFELLKGRNAAVGFEFPPRSGHEST